MRIAIVGCGSIGRRHLRNLQSLGYTDLLVSDPVPAVLDGVAAQFGVSCYARLDEILDQAPAIVMVTAPSHLHVDVAFAAARYNCHLFIEKPLSHSRAGIEMLLCEIRRRHLVTMVGCNMRFHPGPAQVKHWLDESAVGDVLGARLQTGSYLPRWRPSQDYKQSYSASPDWGGAVLDCIHELDLALWLLGEARLYAAVTRPATSLGLPTDGLAELLLEHTSGAISNVHLNFVQRNYRRSIEIIGSVGSIEWDFNAAHVDLYGVDGNLAQRVEQPCGWQINQMYLDEMAYFMRCVQAGEETFNPVALATQPLDIALEARTQKCVR